MQKAYSRSFPKYIDDRIEITIQLSDNMTYLLYNMIESRKVSSWYDFKQDMSFTAYELSDVPEQFVNSLVQHSNAAVGNTASMMYPNKNPQIVSISPTMSFSFAYMPEFDGDAFSIVWDAYGDSSIISIYTADSPLTSLTHTYDSYGTYVIKMSSNVKSLRFSSRQTNILKIESKSNQFNQVKNLQYNRNLLSMKCFGIENIDTEWYDCYELTSLDLPDLLSIDCEYSVNCMFNLEEFKAPNLKTISNATGTFKGDIHLKQLDFPSLTSITGGNGYAFMTCVSLSSVNMPSLKTARPQTFAYCVNLKETNFNSLEVVDQRMFQDCIALKKISLPKAKQIKEWAFFRCQNLSDIYLVGCDEVPELASNLSSAFGGLPSNYKVHVKESMLNDFKMADNWSEIADHICAK